MSPAPDEPLSGDQLEEWLKKGSKKLTIDDETDFVEPHILKGVLKAKVPFFIICIILLRLISRHQNDILKNILNKMLKNCFLVFSDNL